MSIADPAELHWPELTRATKTIVVVDVVESVRLMQANEADTIDRWRRLVHEVRSQVLPGHQGRMVKSLGDGMLLEFDRPPQALAASFDMLQRVGAFNRDRAADSFLRLRVGMHEAEVVVDDMDIYGAGVNLAARIGGIAGSDEVLASAELCSGLIDGVDAEFDDLGECYFKHLDQSVRCTRLRPLAKAQQGIPQSEQPSAQHEAAAWIARLAVLPLRLLGTAPAGSYVGELLADNLSTRLAGNPLLRVISRMSTSALASRNLAVNEIASQLGVAYLVAGTAVMLDPVWRISLELVDARSGEVIWHGRNEFGLEALLSADDDFSAHMAAEISAAISEEQLKRVSTQPWPSLQAFALQLSGVSLMHRASATEFQRGRQVLEALVERHPAAPQPRAALASWWVLNTTRGLSRQPQAEASTALMHTRRALEVDPGFASALAMQGFVQCHMVGDLDAAEDSLARALEANPSESLAWLYSSVVHVLRGRNDEAWHAAETALSLSPLDPQRYYFDALASASAIAAGHVERGVELAERALRVNRRHLPTMRALVIGRIELGQMALAQQAARRVLEVAPDFTIRRYLKDSPKGATVARERFAAALAKAGLPLG